MTTRGHLRSVPHAEPSLTELVSLAAGGDQWAFSEIYRANARYIAGVVFRLLGAPSEVEDVVQETFLVAARSLGTLAEPTSVRGWLVTIAVRQVHRRIAEKVRARSGNAELERHLLAATDPRTASDVHDLYDALERLEPELRIPWILSRIEGLEHSLVAAGCGVSLATVKRRVALAEERLKRRLGHE